MKRLIPLLLTLALFIPYGTQLHGQDWIRTGTGLGVEKIRLAVPDFKAAATDADTKRLTTALHESRYWKCFRVRLCPALAGIELLKDGGFYTAQLDPDAGRPVQFTFHRLPRN